MKQPRLTYWTWKKTIPIFLFFGSMIILSLVILPEMRGRYASAIAISISLVYYLGIRIVLTSYNQRGLRAMDRQQYQKGIANFEKSYDFFKRHGWIDKYRSIVLLEPSVLEYKEMALLNIAFANFKLDNIDDAKRLYKRVLEEYPNNQMVKDILKAMNSN